MDSLTGVLGARQLGLFWWVLASFAGVYVYAFLMARLVIFLRNRRGGDRPYTDEIVHTTTLSGFVLMIILPCYAVLTCSVEAFSSGQYRDLLYLIPYGIVAVVNLLVIIALFSKRRLYPEPTEEVEQ